ncbi:hypothetical protein D3C81_2241270 [compost metagenome]
MRVRKYRKQLRVIAHYMMDGDKRVLIDPYKTDFPDRCKLALAEIFTGKMFELVDAKLTQKLPQTPEKSQ